MDLTSKALTFKKPTEQEVAKPGSGLAYIKQNFGLTTAADKLARRVVAVDKSSSMTGALCGQASSVADLPDNAVQEARDFMANTLTAVAAHGAYAHLSEFAVKVSQFSDAKLAQALVDDPLALALLGMQPKSYRANDNRKIEITREFLLAMIEDRFAANPRDALGIIEFNTMPVTIGKVGDKQSLIDGVQDLQAVGGTTIANAMDAAYEAISSCPSTVGQNQVVTVSDGEDNSFTMRHAEDLFKKSRPFNVVFDFIHLISPRDVSQGALSLKWLAEQSGGQYVSVVTREQYKTKFLEASKRPLLLTAGGSK